MRLLEEHTPQANKTIIMQPGSEVRLGTTDSIVFSQARIVDGQASLQLRNSCDSIEIHQDNKTSKSENIVTVRNIQCLGADIEGSDTSIGNKKVENTTPSPNIACTNGKWKDIIIVVGYVFAIVVSTALLGSNAL
jgi:hypothetical protein